MGGIDGFDRILHLDRVAFDLAEGSDLEIALSHRDLDPFQAGLPVVVVLVKHRYLLVAGRHELLDDLFGLVVIARANVEHVTVDRSAQQFSARERPDQRHLGLGEDGHGRAGRRGTDVGNQSEDLVFLDQLLGGFDAQVRFVPVVPCLEYDPSAENPAPRVRVIKVRLGSNVHLDTQLRGRARESGRLAEQDDLGSHAWRLTERGSGKRN